MGQPSIIIARNEALIKSLTCLLVNVVETGVWSAQQKNLTRSFSRCLYLCSASAWIGFKHIGVITDAVRLLY